MNSLGKVLILAGFGLFAFGGFLYFVSAFFSCPWFDSRSKKKNFFLYIPIGASVIFSVIVGIVIFRLGKR